MAEEYEVLFDWEPENPDDLQLFAGETLEVLQKNDHGWWYGIANRSGTVHKGYFPKNYVKPVDAAPAVPKPPPRPSKTLDPPAPEPDVGKVSSAVESMAIERGPSFSLKSCSAFDELMELGYAVEVDSTSKPTGADAEPLSRGVRVTIHCKAEIWDGASTITKEFANGQVSFVTGENQVTPGLDAAIQKLCVGQKATITCAPTMAYGAAGNPPVVPPNSFVIFTVEVLSSTVPTSQAQQGGASGGGGTQALLGASGVATTRKVKGVENRRGSRVILVGSDGNSGSASPASPAKPAKPAKPSGEGEAPEAR